MWAFATVELGLTFDQFADLTYRQWDALVKRNDVKRRQRDEMCELMLGQLISMVANTGFRGFKEHRRAEEFMPSEWRKVGAGVAPGRTKSGRFKKRSEKALAADFERVFDRAFEYQAGQASQVSGLRLK